MVKKYCESSSVGRASAFQADCRRFEPGLPSLAQAECFFIAFKKTLYGRCSSGVERFLGKEEVTGSIPVIGSI